MLRDFWISCRRFLWAVIKRYYLWFFAIVDPLDIWNRLMVPFGYPHVELTALGSWVVSITVILIVILLAYHELRMMHEPPKRKEPSYADEARMKAQAFAQLKLMPAMKALQEAAHAVSRKVKFADQLDQRLDMIAFLIQEISNPNPSDLDVLVVDDILAGSDLERIANAVRTSVESFRQPAIYTYRAARIFVLEAGEWDDSTQAKFDQLIDAERSVFEGMAELANENWFPHLRQDFIDAHRPEYFKYSGELREAIANQSQAATPQLLRESEEKTPQKSPLG